MQTLGYTIGCWSCQVTVWLCVQEPAQYQASQNSNTDEGMFKTHWINVRNFQRINQNYHFFKRYWRDG